MRRFLFCAVGVFTVAGLASFAFSEGCKQGVYNFLYVPEELQGESHHFPEIDESAYEHAPSLADWDALDLIRNASDGHAILSYRLVGFTEFCDSGYLDFTGSDPDTIAVLQKALSPGLVRRLALSDLSHSGGALDGGHLGVIQLHTTSKDYIIGVYTYCFFWGTYYGSIHQEFESWALSRIVDKLLYDQTGKHLDEEVLKQLSGEATIDEQRNLLSGFLNEENVEGQNE